MKLSRLQGLDSATATTLKTAGLDDSGKLLDAAYVLEDQSELASLLGIDQTTFSELVNRAELSSIQGMGQIYSDLLVSVGITTLVALSNCEPYKLHATIKQSAKAQNVGRIPNRATVEDWIEQANELTKDK
ncbi:MAG: DUF4332 domain-containing protein [Chloroflexota bacterium]